MVTCVDMETEEVVTTTRVNVVIERETADAAVLVRVSSERARVKCGDCEGGGGRPGDGEIDERAGGKVWRMRGGGVHRWNRRTRPRVEVDSDAVDVEEAARVTCGRVECQH